MIRFPGCFLLKVNLFIRIGMHIILWFYTTHLTFYISYTLVSIKIIYLCIDGALLQYHVYLAHNLSKSQNSYSEKFKYAVIEINCNRFYSLSSFWFNFLNEHVIIWINYKDLFLRIHFEFCLDVSYIPYLIE